MTAGIDLMLALVEADHGHELAKAVSRELVVNLRRPGGQSQYAAPAQLEPETDRIRRALSFAREHLSEALPIERLAEAANLSARQFARLFRKETGETPAKAIERMRAEAARIRTNGAGIGRSHRARGGLRGSRADAARLPSQLWTLAADVAPSGPGHGSRCRREHSLAAQPKPVTNLARTHDQSPLAGHWGPVARSAF